MVSEVGKRRKAAQRALERRDWDRFLGYGGAALPVLEERLARVTDLEAHSPQDLFRMVDCWLRMSSVRTTVTPLAVAWRRIKTTGSQSCSPDLSARVLERLNAVAELPDSLREWRSRLLQEAAERDRVSNEEAIKRDALRAQELEQQRRDEWQKVVLVDIAKLDDCQQVDEAAADALGRLLRVCDDIERLDDRTLGRLATLRVLEGRYSLASDYYDSDDPSDWNRTHEFSTDKLRKIAREEVDRRDSSRRKRRRLADQLVLLQCGKCGHDHSKSLRSGMKRSMVVCRCGNLITLR